MSKKRLAKEIFFIQLLVLMSYSSIAVLTLLPLFFKRLGGSPRQIGFLIGLFSLAAFSARPFGGWLLTKVHPGRTLLASLFIFFIATCLYFFIHSLNWLVIVIRIVHGFSFSVFILAALLIVVLMVEEKERTYALGVVSTGFMLPLLIVPYLSEIIIAKLGYFWFLLAAAFLAAITFIFALEAKFRLPEPLAEAGLKGSGFFLLLRQKRIFLIFTLTLIFEIGLSSSLSFVPLLAHQGNGMRSGYFYTFLGLTAAIIRLYVGRWFKFWGRPQLLLPAFGCLGAGGFLIYFAFNNLGLAVSGLVWGIGVGILYPHLSALIVGGVADGDKSKVLSLFASSVDLGFAFGPLFFGWISQALGVRLTFLPFAFLMLLIPALIIGSGRSSLF